MKLHIIMGLVVVAAASTVRGTMTITPIADYSSYSSKHNGGSIGGGEFRASKVSEDLLKATGYLSAYSADTKGIDNGKYFFQTFCIEYNEHFKPGTEYTVSLNDRAMYGGNATDGDPISVGTAFLYSRFAAGTLPADVYSYTYGSGRTASAKALQEAIWVLEGEGSSTYTPVMSTAIYNFLNSNLAGQNWYENAGANNYGVRVMNLGEPGKVQDMLVAVPEPSTLMAGFLLLFPFCASAVRIVRRRG